MSGDIKKWPLYKNAAERFMALNPEPGFVLPDQWLEYELELSYEISSSEEFRQASLERLQIQQFREYLMTEYQVHLDRVRGIGYRVLAPGEATGVAMAGLQCEWTAIMRRTARRLIHVPIEQLDDGQLRENAEARARVAQLRGLTAKAFELPPPPKQMGRD
ncbi:MAG: hypothetical protein EA420_13235 [Candidatus Competibacteraceae bacterium]|nr:MAG: hypothetical protein EA420_13235 [Candidatus Competibacteraceae bacterium]